MSALSSSSIESHMYAIFFVSPSSCSSEESHTYSVSPDSSSLCSSRGFFMLDDSSVLLSHQVSLFLEAVGKKVGAATAGSPCIPSTCQIRLIVWRMYLVGVRILTVSRCRWVAQESWILCSVSEVSPHFALRVFQVPLVMVHPRLGWARVVKSSYVIMGDPCMSSSHRKDFCCIWTQPSPLSDFGSGSFRESSRSVILVLESVIRGGWFTVSGGGCW